MYLLSVSDAYETTTDPNTMLIPHSNEYVPRLRGGRCTVLGPPVTSTLNPSELERTDERHPPPFPNVIADGTPALRWIVEGSNVPRLRSTYTFCVATFLTGGAFGVNDALPEADSPPAVTLAVTTTLRPTLADPILRVERATPAESAVA